MVFLFSLASFVASRRLIRSGIGAIHSHDQSRQVFEQYNTSAVIEKISRASFRWLVVKNSHVWDFLVQEHFLTIRFTRGN